MIKKLLIAISVAFIFVGNAMAATVQYELRIDGISCPFCVATSAKALKKLQGVIKVTSNLEKGIIKVCADDQTNLTDKQLTELFKEKGFSYRSMKKQDKCDEEE